ncbi:MAG: cytochrome c3 family protein [Burkholderiales bacterium]|nr:cytochrome c3 family protein [Burkholderiales bacterium]
MKRLVLAALVFAFGAGFSVCTIAQQQQSIQERHGGVWPESQNGYVTKYQCMSCHGTYDQLGQKTANLEPNPHYSHLGQVNCVECHIPTESRPQVMCLQCHQFDIRPITEDHSAPAK